MCDIIPTDLDGGIEIGDFVYENQWLWVKFMTFVYENQFMNDFCVWNDMRSGQWSSQDWGIETSGLVYENQWLWVKLMIFVCENQYDVLGVCSYGIIV